MNHQPFEEFGRDPGESPYAVCPYCGAEWPKAHGVDCPYTLQESLNRILSAQIEAIEFRPSPPIDGGMEDADQQEPPNHCPHCGQFWNEFHICPDSDTSEPMGSKEE